MTAPLIIVPPVAITDAMLTACDVAEDTNPAWSGATTYGFEDRAYVGHTVYQSLAAGNLNHAVTDEVWWVEVGPTNRWACLDGSNSTQTANSTEMAYEFEPGQAVTSFALLNIDGCNTARLLVTQPSYGTLKDETYDLASIPDAPGWWEWLFGERTAPRELIVQDIPPIPGCTISIELDGTTALAVGVMQLGVAKEIGEGVLQGMRVGIKDYSRKETNEFGETVLVRRTYADTASFQVPIRNEHVENARTYLTGLRATPALWITARGVIYGFFQEFEITFAYSQVSECSLSIQGLS
ncbi:MAG: carbohydrate-binding protein [Rubrivivax sp.]|nr:MAG: carbohydrate-binding protein [Rubrivivax sp.]